MNSRKKGSVLLALLMILSLSLVACEGSTGQQQQTSTTTVRTTAYTGSTASKTTSMNAVLQPVELFATINFQIPGDAVPNPRFNKETSLPDNDQETYQGMVWDYNSGHGQLTVTSMQSKKTDADRLKFLDERRSKDLAASGIMLNNMSDGTVAGAPAKIATAQNANGTRKGVYVTFMIEEYTYTFFFFETDTTDSTPEATSQRILATVQPKAPPA